MDPIAFVLIALIVVAIVALSWVSMKSDRKAKGSEPGKGYHTLRSEYSSGVGGGEQREWKVPRDPQEYAKQFVPKGRKK